MSTPADMPQHCPTPVPRPVRLVWTTVTPAEEGTRCGAHDNETNGDWKHSSINCSPLSKENNMTEPTNFSDEIAVRRGRVQALVLAKAVNADDAEAADLIYAGTEANGTAKTLTAGAICMLLSITRGFAAATGTDVVDALDHLIEGESGAAAMLADLDRLNQEEA